jgi:succinoglycan biosynthesis protein ExoU
MTDPEQPTGHYVTDRPSNETATASVDVLIAARNRADTIARAVSSALAQNEVRAVIVVDDGSVDETAACATRCDPEGKRVIVERLQSSVGPSAARNIAIDISRAPWLAILDGDDFFLPGRIGALLSQADDWDLVADDLLQVSEYRVGHEPPKPYLPDRSAKPRRLSLEQFVLGNVTQGGLLGYLKPLIRRSFLDLHALRYDEALRFGEDYALYARALAAGARFLLIPTTGYVSVGRTDSLSARHSRQDLERLRDSDCELMAMSHLSPSERQTLAKHYLDVDCRGQWLALVEAIKGRNYPRFASTFFHSPTVTLYLIGRLLEAAPSQIRKGCRYLRDR